MQLYKTPRSAIIGQMRRLFSHSQIAKEARRRARSDEKGPKGGVRLICASCGGVFSPKDTELDHIEEVIPLDRATEDLTLDEIWSRMNCKTDWRDTNVDFDNLQVLCKPCHKKKTDAEKIIRKHNRDKRKKDNKKTKKDGKK